ncbi:MAG: hypothetical protein KF817_02960 [Phycisphaeraceae bacterium]|nr:hypothetical protein [Phycisphaeraceae bacterium]
MSAAIFLVVERCSPCTRQAEGLDARSRSVLERSDTRGSVQTNSAG